MPNTREGLDQLKQLGSQNTKYTYDYDPSLLERIPNSTQIVTISSSSTARNSPASARRQDSRTLRPFISPTSPISTWWKASP